MVIFVHILEQAKKDANRHGIGDARLTQFAERIETTQILESFERNNPYPCLVKKKFYDFKTRLVAMQMTVRDATVILLLRVLIRGTPEYDENFEGTASEETTLWYLDKQFRKELSEQVVAEIVASRQQTNPPPKLPNISAEEESFLWMPAYPGVEEDTMVCESHEFVDDLRRTELKNQLVRLPEMIIDAIGSAVQQVSVIVCAHNDRLQLLTYNSPQTDQCVLLRLLHSPPADELKRIQDDWNDKLVAGDHITVLRHCRVSYPSLLCGDEQMWVSIHEGSEGFDNIANLALSPEEGEILNSCDLHDHERAGFPLFINGRAGSGKSTLLQYLFAFSFRRWLVTLGASGDLASVPLYMASSRSLLRVAQRSSSHILSLNSRRLLEGEPFDEAAKTTLSKCFRQTWEYMHSLLPTNDHARFPPDARVDYATFRKLWEKQFGREPQARRNCGAQISWHVIRGLIKGFSPAGLMELDEFDDLPKHERSVSKDTYQRVYDRVWTKWYRHACSSEHRWDDQDLVRYLLDRDLLPRTHVAVFCDEAQDFTRLELEAVYRCSLFSHRALASHNIKRIPFAFAGDPFQTVNPTGFRWESVQAAFTERIVESLHRFDRQQNIPQLHYEELTFNYRSAKRIVHFCNSIQAARAVLFDYRQLQPQSTWRIQDDQNAPVFLDTADIQVRQDLKEQSDLVLIVPCEEGEETDFVAADEFLKGIVKLDEEGVPLNVQSAARSKGLEFRRVALYGWSNRPEAARISDLIRGSKHVPVDVDERLQLEYFMNNLYVAASRAQRRLFVLDDESSREGLWWLVNDEEHLHGVLSQLSGSWNSRVGTMVSGGSESFCFDKDTNRRRAEQQREEGLARRSAFTLKQAAQYFELERNVVEANRCRGYAFSFAQRHMDSARCFEVAGDHKEAVQSLWCGRLFEKLAEFAGRHPEYANVPECETAMLLSDEDATCGECIELLRNLAAAANRDEAFARTLRAPLWSDAIERALKKGIASARRQHTPRVEANVMADQLDELLAQGLKVDNKVWAALHFTAENYSKVVKLLAEERSSEMYRDAMALSLLADAHAGHLISESDSAVVGEYLMRQQPSQLGHASQYFLKSRELGKQLECFRRAAELEDVRDAELAEVICSTIKGAIDRRDWGNLISILRRGQPKGVKDDSANRRRGGITAWSQRVLSLIGEHRMQWKLVVPQLAKTEGFNNDTGQEKQQVQEYLKDLVGNQDWRKYIKPKVLGAAIERADKDIDALVFYENWMEYAHEPNEKRYAQIRWVVCKLRQAERQDSLTNRKEAQRVLDKYGWDEAVIKEEYPDIDDPVIEITSTSTGSKTAPNVSSFESTVQKLRDREAQQLGELEFKLLLAKGWVNIESEDGLRARILIADQTIESSDVDFVQMNQHSYRCEEWNVDIAWLPDGSVKFSHSGCELATPTRHHT